MLILQLIEGVKQSNTIKLQCTKKENDESLFSVTMCVKPPFTKPCSWTSEFSEFFILLNHNSKYIVYMTILNYNRVLLCNFRKKLFGFSTHDQKSNRYLHKIPAFVFCFFKFSVMFLFRRPRFILYLEHAICIRGFLLYIYNIRTLSVNIKFICTSFRNRQNSEPSASFSGLFRSEYKWILYLTTMYVYCVYPAMSKK